MILTLKCPACDLMFEMDDADPHCPACGGIDLLVRERVKRTESEMLLKAGGLVMIGFAAGIGAWWWLSRAGDAPSTLTVILFFAFAQLVDAWSTYLFLSATPHAREMASLPRKLFARFGLAKGLVIHTVIIASAYCSVLVLLGLKSVLFVVATTKLIAAVNNYRLYLATEPAPTPSITG